MQRWPAAEPRLIPARDHQCGRLLGIGPLVLERGVLTVNRPKSHPLVPLPGGQFSPVADTDDVGLWPATMGGLVHPSEGVTNLVRMVRPGWGNGVVQSPRLPGAARQRLSGCGSGECWSGRPRRWGTVSKSAGSGSAAAAPACWSGPCFGCRPVLVYGAAAADVTAGSCRPDGPGCGQDDHGRAVHTKSPGPPSQALIQHLAITARSSCASSYCRNHLSDSK